MRVMLAAAAASGLVLLSGCGVAGTQFHPGLAAQVEDGSVSTDEVDAAASAFCTYLLGQGDVAKNPLSLRSLRSQVASQLTLIEATKQVAQERGVTTGKTYQQSLAAAESDPDLKTLDDDERKDVVALNSSSAFIGDIINGLGAQVATAQGKKIPDSPQAANALTFPLGAKSLGDWITSHDIEIDPRYDVQLGVKDGQLQSIPTDEGISFATGAVAKAGLAAGLTQQPDPAQVAALPASQRCGGAATAGPVPTGVPTVSDAPLPTAP